jgi:Flp pilus assembly protein TadB
VSDVSDPSHRNDAPRTPQEDELPTTGENGSRQPEQAPLPEPRRISADQTQIDPDRPSLAGLDEWIRKNTLVSMGLVVATAFVAKAIAPFHSFTIGLLLGVIAVVSLYMLGFYLGRGKA